LALQPLMKKYFPQPPAAEPQTAQTQKPISPATSHTEATAVVVPASAASKQASAESESVIENDLYKITFTNRGAQVKSWILKKFDNETQNGPLDLVNLDASQRYGYPLSLWTYDESMRQRLNSLLYVTSQEGRQTAPASITFEYTDQDLAVRK